MLTSHSICSQCSVTADGVCADAKQSCDTNKDRFFYRMEIDNKYKVREKRESEIKLSDLRKK